MAGESAGRCRAHPLCSAHYNYLDSEILADGENARLIRGSRDRPVMLVIRAPGAMQSTGQTIESLRRRRR